MGYYGMITAISLDFINVIKLRKCLDELEELDVGDPLRDNIDLDISEFSDLQEYDIKLNGDEKEYLPIISKYAMGIIEVQGDEIGDFRKWILYGNGEYSIHYGKVVYDV
jgi:hypothetical protein